MRGGDFAHRAPQPPDDRVFLRGDERTGLVRGSDDCGFVQRLLGTAQVGLLNPLQHAPVAEPESDVTAPTTEGKVVTLLIVALIFGLLAVELGVYLAVERGAGLSRGLAVVFFLMSMLFVWRSFYGMRIESEQPVTA